MVSNDCKERCRDFGMLVENIICMADCYDESGKYIIKGHHEFVSPISVSLQKRLTENGMPKLVLDRIIRGEAIAC